MVSGVPESQSQTGKPICSPEEYRQMIGAKQGIGSAINSLMSLGLNIVGQIMYSGLRSLDNTCSGDVFGEFAKILDAKSALDKEKGLGVYFSREA